MLRDGRGVKGAPTFFVGAFISTLDAAHGAPRIKSGTRPKRFTWASSLADSFFADSFRLIPTKARLVESCDGTLRFHQSSIRSVI